MSESIWRNGAARIAVAGGLMLALLLVLPETVSAQDTTLDSWVEGQVIEGGPVADPVSPGIPRIEPGQVLPLNDLDVRMAMGETADPLAGNYTMLSTDKIVLAWHSPSTTVPFCSKPYDIPAALGPPVAKTKGCDQWGTMLAGNNVDAVTGHLLSPLPYIDTLLLTDFENNRLTASIRRYNSSLAQYQNVRYYITSAEVDGVTYATATSELLAYGGTARAAAGDFDGDGWDEFVLGWESNSHSFKLQWFKPARDDLNTIWAKEVISVGGLGSYRFLDVAAADFNGDGLDEIATAWSDASGHLVVGVYAATADGKLVLKAQYAETAAVGNIVLASGDLNGDGVAEIVVGFNTQPNANIYVFRASSDLSTLTRKAVVNAPSSNGYSTTYEQVGRTLGLAAGDFNGDGDDELALMRPFADPHNIVGTLTIYDVDGSFAVTQKVSAKNSNWSAYSTTDLDAGDLNGDMVDELVMAQVGRFPYLVTDITTSVTQIAPDLLSFVEKGRTADEQVYMDSAKIRGNIALAVGAFDGNAVWLGPPSYQHQSRTLQNVAVINSPPKHGDEIEINGVITDIDVNIEDTCLLVPCTYAKYENEQKSSTSMSVSTTRDWSVSSEANLKIPHLKASMEATYGESFEKTTTSYQSTSFGTDVEADTDDVVVRLQQDLDIWEYPVYTDTSGTIQGHILVVWPTKVDPLCTSNCPASLTARIDAMNPGSGYQPDHEWGNILSYSPLAPTNISTTIKSDYVNNLGSNYTEAWMKWTDIESSQEKQSSKLDLGASLAVSGWGQSLSTSGSYSQGDVSVNKVGFQTTTALHVYFWGIAQKYSYTVRPFIYWAGPDGHLVLDYSVALPVDPQNWWLKTYNKPDPTFNLPWKDGKMDNDYYLELTREIVFDPATAEPNQNVAVTAKLRNYSPVGASNVLVYFYLGDPAAGGTKIGEATIPLLNPLSHATVGATFSTAGYTDGEELHIYAVVDPNNTIEEMHEEYNKAYAVLPIKANVLGGPPGLRTLALSAEDIVVEQPAPGGSFSISATVHAIDATFTYVAVEFWDGTPRAGGRQIGSSMIPVIPGGEARTVRIKWTPDTALGTHELWVGILPNPSDQIMNDNYAHTEVEFEPYRAIMPFIGKQ